jgi:hypothetical protein
VRIVLTGFPGRYRLCKQERRKAMTAAKARAYAERQYAEIIEPVSIVSEQTATLIKDRIAHAYMDGAIEVLGSMGFGKPETSEQRIERGARELGVFA